VHLYTSLSRKVVLAIKLEKDRIFLSIYHPPLDKKYLIEQVTQKLYHIFHGNKVNLFWAETNFKAIVYTEEEL
jgi:hypothetical protein